MGKVFMGGGKVGMTKPVALPSGYTALAYIKSSGTQYIDTGFIPNQDSRVTMDFQSDAITSAPKALFGGRTASSSNAFSMWLGIGVVNPQYGSIAFNKNTMSIDPTNRLTYDLNKNIATVGDITKTFTYASFDAGYSLKLFTTCAASTVDTRMASGKLYSCKVYDNGTLVRDFIPCVSNTGAIGLYDLVGRQFYANAGTGTFTGSEVA